MLRTNYRCVQSTNISLDVAKCGENFHKFTHCTHFSSVTKKWLVLTEHHHGKVSTHSGCPLMLRTNKMCSVIQHHSWDVAKCGDNFHNSLHSLFFCYKKMSCQHEFSVAKCENFHKFTLYTHYLSVTKNDLSWLNNLFMVRTQLISMSSYAKNKLQMCSVNNISLDCRQMCGKFSQIHPVHSPFEWICENLFMVSKFGDLSTLMLGHWTHLQFILSIRRHTNELKLYHK